MRKCHWCAALVLAVCVSNTATAQEATETETLGQISAAMSGVFPGMRFSIWDGAAGDLNEDGIEDYAAVVVLPDGKEGRREERLVVFAGASDGSYKPISLSGQFCEPEKFYNLSISTNTLFVQAVSYADSARAASFTLQFRYNAKLDDFELIGRKDDSVEYDENSSYRVSVNYLTKVIRLSRHLGKSYIKRSTTADGIEKIVKYSRRSGKHREAKTQFDNSMLFRLQGFECAGYSAPDTGVYIDEKFKVHNPKMMP